MRKERILAVIMSVLMALSMLPITVYMFFHHFVLQTQKISPSVHCRTGIFPQLFFQFQVLRPLQSDIHRMAV